MQIGKGRLKAHAAELIWIWAGAVFAWIAPAPASIACLGIALVLFWLVPTSC